MITSVLNKLNINAIFDEEELHHAPDGLQGDINRQELQEKNNYFLKRLKEKFFPVKSEEQDQFLFPFLKNLPAGRSTDKRNRKRQVKKSLKREFNMKQLQLFLDF